MSHSHPIYYFGGETLLAMRQDNLKYQKQKSISYGVEPSRIAFSIPIGPWLFDLDNDPFESYNLLNKKTITDPIVGQFHAAAEDFLEKPRGWSD